MRTRTLNKYLTLGNDMYAKVLRVKCANACNFTLKCIKKRIAMWVGKVIKYNHKVK